MQTTDRRICIIINKQQTTTTLLFLKGNHLFQVSLVGDCLFSILSGSLSELKKEPAFCFRSSIHKQQTTTTTTTLLFLKRKSSLPSKSSWWIFVSIVSGSLSEVKKSRYFFLDHQSTNNKNNNNSNYCCCCSFSSKSWWLFVSIMSGSLLELKRAGIFFFRSSTNKQQQRFFLKENHLFRINLGGCLCLNSVWFSVSIIEELVVCFRLLFGSGGFSTPYLIICFPVFQPSRRRRRRRSILILQLRTSKKQNLQP
jgi:hypothetical protein